MISRWLTGAILFALGFGSAMMTRLPATDAANTANTAVKEVAIPGTPLTYIDGEDFRLKYPAGGKTDYLVAVVRKAGTTAAGSQISYKVGEAVFSKKDLESLTVFEVKPLISLQQPPARPPLPAAQARATAVSARPFRTIRCGDPHVYCPLPPPPDPPIRVSMTSVKTASWRP